ncbi:MAG: ZIP family metal transporter [bacterium]
MTPPNDPVLTVLLFTSLAAAAAAAGAIPFALRTPVPMEWLGCAYALASGLMLGAGYLLMAEGLLRHPPLITTLGAGLGVAYTYWTHAYSGTEEIETLPGGEVEEAAGYKLILLNTLHSASEGVAIGTAMVVSLRLGIFLALALAVHNAAEGMALTNVLRGRRMPLGASAVLCVVTNAPQVLLAVAAFAVVRAAGGLLPWALGFSAGALVYLVLTELLPDSYRRAGRTCIAALVSLSAGLLVLLKGYWG